MTYHSIDAIVENLEKLLEKPPFKITFEGGGLPEPSSFSPEEMRLISRGELMDMIRVLKDVKLIPKKTR